MSNANLKPRFWSLDDKLVLMDAPVKGGPNGTSLLLRQFVPPSSATPGKFVNANPFGIEGVVGVRTNKPIAGDSFGNFTLVFQDGYQRIKRGTLTLLDPAGVTPVANAVEYLGEGSPLAPSQTSLSTHTFYASVDGAGGGSTVSTAPHAQPTFTVASATFPTSPNLAGAMLTDDSGGQFTIISNTATALTVAGVQRPSAAGAGTKTWWITVGGVTVFTHLTFTGNTSSAAFSAATWTDSAATWNTNQFQGQVLNDTNGAEFVIASNTQTVLTLQSVGSTQFAAAPDPTGATTSPYSISAGFSIGSLVVQVSGTAGTGSATAGIGSTPGFTPMFVGTDAMFAGQFGGMILFDSNQSQWMILDNTSSALTIAPLNVPAAFSQTVAASGAWSVQAVTGAASIELILSSSSDSVTVSITGAPSVTVTNATSAVSMTTPTIQFSSGTATSTTGATAGTGVTTLTAGITTAPTGFGINALAGAFVTDGTLSGVVIANGTITAAGGTMSGTAAITTVPKLTATISGALTIVSMAGVAAAQSNTVTTSKGTLAASGTATTSATVASPAANEVMVLETQFSDAVTGG